ncbi:membrane-bound inhibitor of C-type lysozyme [Erwinia toletana]|uniref:Membrane-bound inhibitor of C-type lysozyme n=1 Tax=Winslowiella toletana TaxID=92490 RepID=A0ABS4PH84_9GAMM|nr:MliC family protein [Winslowiella toletana]MBP2171253.1 membrane-bound inhibitor of C-type lysozyme [Winslowiella toletana]
MKKCLIIATALSTLSGCGLLSQPQGDQIQTLHYRCGTLPLTVKLNNSQQQVSLIMDGTPLTLKQQPAASGTRYSDGNYVFWSKGEGAFIERNDKIIVDDCQLQSGS